VKKFLLVVFFAAAAAFGIWFGMHGGSSKSSSAAVTALLPKETLALVHVPDVNAARAKWHETDIYKLWREPAVQDFLQKPLSKTPNAGAIHEKLQQIEPLQVKDAFFAVLDWENQQSKMVAGFRFKGSADDAEKVVGQWRARLPQNTTSTTRETVEYQKHRIEVTRSGWITLATVYTDDWFFGANDLATLQALLDRADGRTRDSGSTLASDEEFIAGGKHLPGGYIVRVFGRLDRYLAKLPALFPQSSSTIPADSILRQLRSISAATAFENGKVRDVLVVGMPKSVETGELTRDSLSLATRDSFLYLASFLKLPNAQNTALPAPTQRLLGTLTASGVTMETWNAAFGAELGVIADWSANSRVPFLFATLPVKDAAKASELVASITSAANDGSAWTKSEKGGVQYYTQPPISPMVPVAPCIALSANRLVFGHDLAAVEAMIGRSGSELQGSDAYKTAERLVHAPSTSFVYFDTALFYTRLDAAVRPMLVMAAAFLPSIAQTVDLGKLPPPEIITKHLSPIVTSQWYETDGYVTESVGPVSLFHALGAIATASGVGASFYKDQMRDFTQPSPTTSTAPPPPALAVSPTPTPP
jgi:hypothetical protein